jgi:predicted Zn-dependent protease
MLLIFLFIIFCVPVFAATEIRDTEIENCLARLLTPVARAADIPDGRLKIHIIASDDFNAFVSGGDDVFIYTGLLTQIKSSAALQAVVAHELGHLIGGHITQLSAQKEREMTRSLIMQALGVGLMVANPMAGAGVMMGAGSVASQSLMAFSRDEERLADDAAINLLNKAGLNPNSLIVVLEQMNEMMEHTETRMNPMNSGHPQTAARLQNAREKIGKSANRKIKSDENYEMIRAKLIGYMGTNDMVLSKYPNSDKSDAALYAHAIRQMRSGNLTDAETGTKTLISRHKNNPYFYELLGDIEYQFGHYDDSVAAYEKSLKLIKDAPQIQTALALVLTERKKSDDITRAMELARTAILTQPTPLAYWVLVLAYGDDARSDWARAEYYHLIGDKKNTKKYARSAQKKLQKNSPEYIKSGELLSSD